MEIGHTRRASTDNAATIWLRWCAEHCSFTTSNNNRLYIFPPIIKLHSLASLAAAVSLWCCTPCHQQCRNRRCGGEVARCTNVCVVSEIICDGHTGCFFFFFLSPFSLFEGIHRITPTHFRDEHRFQLPKRNLGAQLEEERQQRAKKKNLWMCCCGR